MRNVIDAHDDIYTGDDTLAHWKFNAASGANETDSSGNGYTLTDAGTVPAAGSLHEPNSASTGSKNFDGSADHFTNAANTAARNAHNAENLTVEGLIRPDNLTGDATVYYFGGDPTSSTSANNILFRVTVSNATGTIAVRREYGSGTSNVYTSTIAIDASQPWYFAVVKRSTVTGSAGNVDLLVYLWGWDGTYRSEEIATDVANSDGGSSATWTIGRNGTASDYFDGLIDEICVSSFAKTEEGVRDSFKRLRQDWSTNRLYSTNAYATDLRILVEDASGDFVDLSDFYGYNFVLGAAWGEDVDDQGATANISLAREIYNYILSPGLTSGPGSDLLKLTRKVKIETATKPLDYGVTPAWAWDLVFEGTISGVHWGEDPIRVFCRGREGALINNYIVTPLLSNAPRGSSGGTAVETEMQAMIDDYEPANVSGSYGTYIGEDGPPQIYTPTSPGWNVREWNQENMSTMEACSRLADMIGWVFRYRYDENRSQFRLTFEEPDRSTTTALWTFTGSDYLSVDELEIDEGDIRNYCRVYFGDRNGTDGALGDYERTFAVAVDAASIAKYGFRGCEISEAATSIIDASTEAQALADAVVADLKEPKATVSLTTPYKHFVQLRDLYQFSANAVHFDADQKLAVTSYQHQASANGDITTTLRLRGTPAARYRRRIEMIAQPGAAPTRGVNGPATPSSPTVLQGIRKAEVSWDAPVNNLNGLYDWTEVHASTTSGFTPSSSTLQVVTRGTSATLRGLDPNSTWYVKIVHLDRVSRYANRSAASAQTAFTPTYESWARATGSPTTIGTSYTKIAFTSEVFDTGSDFASNTYTAPAGGVVTVKGCVSVRVGATWGQSAVYKNGSIYQAGPVAVLDLPGGGSVINVDIPVAAGDTLEIYARAGTAGQTAVDPTWVEFRFAE